jgi:hypothetical protein
MLGFPNKHTVNPVPLTPLGVRKAQGRRIILYIATAYLVSIQYPDRTASRLNAIKTRKPFRPGGTAASGARAQLRLRGHLWRLGLYVS